ncbi:hypothetical protein PHYSODRAFT_339414 [Phytophthora sojae]|uniref:Uncharacterized protein n=1 Tax=Phytophthora sojae (strain P6497) TaxID=1094619 RepID=G5A6R9_PHYSP|nr:hypothetical protein PHYSODRAFT_339414 [Phytophthora sojae]EGZ09024.1 hypothetical protein PHYSODRAFT_339414 [Phytophthora sojae]|eukprot:XP_009535657.1 hypothetical protein PHYSODRAFT_339414 [Phytophthora sojae]
MVVEEMLAFCEGLSNPQLGVGAYHRSSCEAHAHGSRTQIKGGVTHYGAARSVNYDFCYGLYPERGEEYADGSIKNIHLVGHSDGQHPHPRKPRGAVQEPHQYLRGEQLRHDAQHHASE